MKIMKKCLASLLAVLMLVSMCAIGASAKEDIKRYNVMVLDQSGSMNGQPLVELKKACKKFVQELFANGGDNYIAIVAFESDAYTVLDFSNNETVINNKIDSLSDEYQTNISAGINRALSLFDNLYSTVNPIDIISNVLVMSDGVPNRGLTEVEQFEQLMDSVYSKYSYINFYSFGYFHRISSSNKVKAEQVLRAIGSYTEVSDGSTLEFTFGEVSDVSKVKIRIACPVDVEVSIPGVSAVLSKDNTNPYFGSLNFEDGGETKIVELRYREDYEILIRGTGSGTMDYEISYMLNNGDIVNSASFEDVKITDKTLIRTTFNDDTFNDLADEILYIDFDGDGNVDEEMHPGKDKELSPFEKFLSTLFTIIAAPFMGLWTILSTVFGFIVAVLSLPFASLFDASSLK